MVGLADGADALLVWCVRKVELADCRTDDASRVSVAVAEGAGGDDEA